MSAQTVYIAFYKGNKRLTNCKSLYYRASDTLIRWCTGGKYSHCEAVVTRPDGCYDCYSASARDGGVRHKVINLNDGKWELIPCRCPAKQLRRFYRRHRQSGYDWRGLFAFVLPWLKPSPTRFFCSEFVAAFLCLPNACSYHPNNLYQHLTESL